MAGLTLVEVPGETLSRFRPLIGEERYAELDAAATRARSLFAGSTLWNVNSTAEGGGVAEMLQVLVGYVTGLGIANHWTVIDGDPQFFEITKRVHNRIHGIHGDDGDLGPAERDHYRRVMAANAARLVEQVEPGDVVLLHDPQTAGMAAALVEHGAVVIWRCHIGTAAPNWLSEQAWDFLKPELEPCRAFVFSVRSYVPAWLTGADVTVIPPSIDPFSPKNQDLGEKQMRAILAQLGVGRPDHDRAHAEFVRRDGTHGHVVHQPSLIGASPVPLDVPLVVQVSRWDHLKDMQGVLEGFAAGVVDRTDAHLLLVGPTVAGVSDDPEGAQVLAECVAAWGALPRSTRRRITLLNLPMDDVDENAAMVNALQRHAAIVTQKSLAEGFGITVTEAMWKGRPVVASAVGGIPDQLGPDAGILLADPTDLGAFADALVALLTRPDALTAMGQRARRRVLEGYVGDRHLIHYADLIDRLTVARVA